VEPDALPQAVSKDVNSARDSRIDIAFFMIRYLQILM
jgi:hypothetical protein